MSIWEIHRTENDIVANIKHNMRNRGYNIEDVWWSNDLNPAIETPVVKFKFAFIDNANKFATDFSYNGIEPPRDENDKTIIVISQAKASHVFKFNTTLGATVTNHTKWGGETMFNAITGKSELYKPPQGVGQGVRYQPPRFHTDPATIINGIKIAEYVHPLVIAFYGNEGDCLFGNFYEMSNYSYDGIPYKTTEGAFQAQKIKRDSRHLYSNLSGEAAFQLKRQHQNNITITNPEYRNQLNQFDANKWNKESKHIMKKKYYNKNLQEQMNMANV